MTCCFTRTYVELHIPTTVLVSSILPFLLDLSREWTSLVGKHWPPGRGVVFTRGCVCWRWKGARMWWCGPMARSPSWGMVKWWEAHSRWHLASAGDAIWPLLSYYTVQVGREDDCWSCSCCTGVFCHPHIDHANGCSEEFCSGDFSVMVGAKRYKATLQQIRLSWLDWIYVYNYILIYIFVRILYCILHCTHSNLVL